MVVLEQPAQSLSSLDNALSMRHYPADHHIADTLMTTLIVIVDYIVRYVTGPRAVQTSVVKKVDTSTWWFQSFGDYNRGGSK
jgi:hypothetical protein